MPAGPQGVTVTALRIAVGAAVLVAVAAPAVSTRALAQPAAGAGLPRVAVLPCTPHSFPQRTQRSFAIDPTAERVLYVGVEQEGFFKSTDGGLSWSRADTGIKAWPRADGSGRPCYEEFYDIVINPANPRELCIAMAGGPGVIGTPSTAANNGVYCSTDAAATWTQRLSPGMNAAVLGLAADTRDFATMYAGVNGGPCSNPPPACAPGTYFNSRGAIYKTIDGGATWTELDALFQPDLRVNVLRIDARNPDVVVAASFSKLAGGGPGNFGEAVQIGVLRSIDAGETWSASTRGMNRDAREQALLDLDVAPQNAMRVFVSAASNRSYWSDDGGVTFHPTQRMATVAFDPHDARCLHLLGCNGENIVESRDGGSTWRANGRTPGFVSYEQGVPTRIAWSPSDPRHIFIAGPYAAVYDSTDGGATWRPLLSSSKLPR